MKIILTAITALVLQYHVLAQCCTVCVLQNLTGFMAGSRNEHCGIIKDGVKLICFSCRCV